MCGPFPTLKATKLNEILFHFHLGGLYEKGISLDVKLVKIHGKYFITLNIKKKNIEKRLIQKTIE